jgi:uncharacterized protein DUF6448
MTLQLRLISIVFMMVLFVSPRAARAHCDTMTGPVVRAARVALERNDVAPLLVWVKEPQETEVRQAFEKTMAVRHLNAAAQELADRYFFETVVRLHRAGEGEPFTGLKDTVEKDEILESADEALECGVIDRLVKLVTERVATSIRERYARVMAAQASADRDIAAGRRYVEAYIEFMHYVEALTSGLRANAPSSPDSHRPSR